MDYLAENLRRGILVDDQDEHLLRRYLWTVGERTSTHIFYATTRISGRLVQLHRLVLGEDTCGDIDHENRNGLDCRRRNLRAATRSQNNANQTLSRMNRSGYKGVSRAADERNPWRANINQGGRQLHLGCFATREEAARAYDRKAVELYGEFARTNEMLGLYPWQKDEAAD